MSDLTLIILGFAGFLALSVIHLLAGVAKLARAKAKLLKAETEHLRAVTAANFPSKPQDTDSK